jgi:hypothetical protein
MQHHQSAGCTLEDTPRDRQSQASFQFALLYVGRPIARWNPSLYSSSLRNHTFQNAFRWNCNRDPYRITIGGCCNLNFRSLGTALKSELQQTKQTWPQSAGLESNQTRAVGTRFTN